MSAPVTPAQVKAVIADPSSSLCANFKNAILQFPVLIYKIINYLFDSDGNPTTAFRDAASYLKTGDIFESARVNDVTDSTRLLCDGSAVSRSTYAALFAVCGTRFGAGDGSTTFNVPNKVNKFGVGAGGLYSLGATGGAVSHTMVEANIPQHSHTLSFILDDASGGNEIVLGGTANNTGNGSEDRTASTYGHASPTPVPTLPPYLAVNYYIKT